MSSETIVFNGITFRRYPDSKHRSDRVYFTPGAWDKCKGFKRLHEEIWKEANGPIPGGFHIHHMDHDPLNNNLDNLEATPAADHHRHHAESEEVQKRLNSPEWQEHLESIRPMAAAWHSSPEGIEWHREHGKKVYETRAVKAGKCEQCGDAFLSKDPGRFCSNKCKSSHRRGSGVDDVQRSCEQCASEFTVNKYSKIRFCSRSCASTNARGKKKPSRMK